MRLILLIFGILSTFYAFSNVNISINQKSYSYTENPRLADVLKPFAIEENWYWPATALYRKNSNNIEEKRAIVLSELKTVYSQQTDPKFKKALVYLEQQIIAWQLVERIFIDIDYDKARIQAEHNPSFKDGDYLLLLKERPEAVSVFGMLENARAIPLLSMTTSYEYLKGIDVSEGSDKSFVFIIQADGSVKKVGIAYWNRVDHQIMPGGQLYIPIAERLFSNRIDELNKKIAELAANRVIQ